LFQILLPITNNLLIARETWTRSTPIGTAIRESTDPPFAFNTKLTIGSSQTTEMTSALLPEKKFFLDKKFYLYVRRSSAANIEKSAELIRLFGGQIEQFLDHEVTYVLTDVSKNEWPPNGRDSTLEKAFNHGVKIMSLHDLLLWCSQYLCSQFSSDDDEETRANTNQLRQPFIKFEDMNCHYSPSIKEFIRWPSVNLTTNLPVGKSFFNDSSVVSTPNQSANNTNHPNNSAQLTQQATSVRVLTSHLVTNSTSVANQPSNSNNNNFNGRMIQQNNLIQTNAAKNSVQLANQHAHRGVRRRHSAYCEICNQKIADRIEEHIQTPAHKANTEKLNWSEVSSVIDSLPSLSTLNMLRLTNLAPPDGIEHQEFLCLHKVDSVSQLFCNSNKDFHSLGSLADRKLVHLV